VGLEEENMITFLQFLEQEKEEPDLVDGPETDLNKKKKKKALGQQRSYGSTPRISGPPAPSAHYATRNPGWGGY